MVIIKHAKGDPTRMELVMTPAFTSAYTPESRGAPGCAERTESTVARNTRRAVASDLRYLNSWHRVRFGVSLPLAACPPRSVPEATVIHFIDDHVGGLPRGVEVLLVAAGAKRTRRPHALATIERRVASLGRAHLGQGFANPCAADSVRELLASARRQHRRAERLTRRKRAATREILDRMLATCGDEVAGLRDRALLLFAFATGGRRRSEVAAARAEDLVPARHGYSFLLERPGTDCAVELPVVGLAAEAMSAWLEVSAIKAGPIFRPVDRWGRLGDCGLSGRAVAEIVKRRAEAAGMAPDAFGAHSLRAGFLMEAGRRGVSLGDAMALSTHRSVAAAMRYFRAGTRHQNPGARLAE